MSCSELASLAFVVACHARTGWRPLLAVLTIACVLPAWAAPPERGRIASVRDCELTYEIHQPAQARRGPVAIIAHGFLRDASYMAGWSKAVAAAGFTAVAVDFCTSSSGEGRHADNAADLVALRRALRVHDAVYIGVSAGGLAALVAASLDPEGTRGLLLLDPVNAGGQARSAAGKVRVPVAALVAKPQVCNAWRNIDPALATLADVTTVPVPQASHCDFEWPTDRFCRVACIAHNSDDEREHAQQRIRRVGIGYLRAVAEGTPEALARWRGDIGSE
jgi:pimeloyl-ACP methyl ester carboxylesterase